MAASIKLDYQLYGDSWGVLGHTLDARFARELGEHWRVDGFFRMYKQSAASFWKREYTVSDPMSVPRYRTADRNLSDYTTVSPGTRVQWERNSWSLYAEGSAMLTRFDSFLFLEKRLALVAMTGVRWSPSAKLLLTTTTNSLPPTSFSERLLPSRTGIPMA